ncbi:MAG: D-glycero-beta-D-manno-heptose 1,7-bisphosphate 7-phosphatase [Armatimonadota bacterium]
MARRAVFLDRDGTIIREANYLRSPEQVRLLPGAATAVRRLNEAGFVVVLVTNQSGIARGLLTEADLALTNEVLEQRLARKGALLDAVYFCPHHPEVGPPQYRRRCDCRKPAPGMLLCAAKDLGLDLKRSFIVGDNASDMGAGRAAGCRTVLVRTGYGRETETGGGADADHVADDLAGAAEWILGSSGEPGAAPRSR